MLHAEVVNVVHDLAKKNRKRFRASYVAGLAGLPVDVVQKNLVALAQIGDLRMNFEVMCPDTGETLATFGLRDEIPKTFSHDECGDGEEFDVTTQLIWVTFTPTEELLTQLGKQIAGPEAHPEGNDPPGNPLGPCQPGPTRAFRTSSLRTTVSTSTVRDPRWLSMITGSTFRLS